MPGFSWARTSSLAAVLLTAACAPLLAPVSQADVARAQARFPGTTTADLEHGRALYAVKCTGCHALEPATRHRPDEWPDEVNRMLRSAHLDRGEADAIIRYLVVSSTPTDATPPR